MIICLLGAQEGSAKTFRQEFMVEAGVFDAAKVSIDFNQFDDKYVIATEVQTANVFGSLYPFWAKYEARGSLKKNDVVPLFYLTKTKTRNHQREKKIFYDKNGVAYKRVSKKDDKESQKMINNVPKSSDAADLQSVLAELMIGWRKTKSCNLEREIYDGKKHYKVIVEDKGIENRWFDFLDKKQNTHKCSVYIKNLKENNDNILWDVSADKPINMWIYENKESGFFEIYEINIDKTMVGSIVVYPLK